MCRSMVDIQKVRWPISATRVIFLSRDPELQTQDPDFVTQDPELQSQDPEMKKQRLVEITVSRKKLRSLLDGFCNEL